MRKLIKAISSILAVAYILMIPLTAFAATGTTSSTGDSALLDKWKGLGLLDKGVSTSEMSQPIQKIEFIRFINSILKTSKQADIDYIDVPKDSWYGEEIAKAVASGYVANQEKTNFYPFSNISRLDAAIMVAKAFGLELSDKKLLNKITDAEKLDAIQLEAFGAVVEKGYLSQISTGRYAPLGVLKLIDSMKMLDKCIGLVITKSGTITKDVTGNMIINASSVILKDMKITGDLIIGEGVADGTVTLENVSVKGKMVIRGGGTNGVTIKNSSIADNLVVEKFAGNVNVIAQGTTTIEQTYLKSGGTLSETNLTSGKGFVNVTAAQAVSVNQIAKLLGEFSNIQMTSSNINISLNGKAEDIKILKDTVARFSLAAGNIKSITTEASKATIELLGGTVTTLNVEAGAKGNQLDINGVTTVSKISISGTTAINFDKGTVESLTFNSTASGSYLGMKKEAYMKNVVASAATTITGLGKIDNAYVYANDVNIDIRPGGVYIANGIVAYVNGTVIDPTKVDVSFSVRNGAKIDVKVNDSKDIIIDGLWPTNSTMTYISSDNSIATVSDKGVLTGVNLGTTKIHVMGQSSNYNTKVVDIDVAVSSNNVTASGSLTITPNTGETGTYKNLDLIYTPLDDMSNGTLVIKLPGEFSAYETDTVIIGTGSEKALDSSQRPNSQTLSFTNLDLNHTQSIIVKLKNKIVPKGGEYTFTAISDADGTGPKLPSSGDVEKAVFTSDSLRKLIVTTNYSTPEYGSTGGTTKISKLSTAGITTGAEKWLIKVQDGAFTVPNFNDNLTGAGYTSYTRDQDIPVTANQHLILVAVDDYDNNRVKAYADITIDGSWIRPYDAGQLELGSGSIVPGVQANAVRINGLTSISVDGADHWMIKVQNTAATTIFVDTVFAESIPYISGDDISVYEGQHIVLAAVDSKNNIKAYKDIQVTSAMISKPAVLLQLGKNYSNPVYGSDKGTTKIEVLDNGGSLGGLTTVSKWMLVTLSKDSVIPGLNSTTLEFERYTEGKTFTEYTANSNITAINGQHLLLVGVEVEGTTTNKIKAYVQLPVDASQIRQATALEIPDANIGTLVMGSKAFTTQFATLSLTGSAILVDATKFMVKVQNKSLTEPQIDSVLSGSIDYTANTDIKVSDGMTTIVLIATDAKGKIKAYKNIVIKDGQIRPMDALTLTNPNDYSLSAGNAIGSTKIALTPNYTKWKYKVQNTAFDVPYSGSKIDAIDYTPGVEIIDITVNQHLLLIAVDINGNTLAYSDHLVKSTEVKQPLAAILKSNIDQTVGYNYSVPGPGQTGGTTRIASLNFYGLKDVTRWLFMISNTEIARPDYNNTLSGFSTYTQGTSVEVKEGQYFILAAVDDSNRIKGFACIPLTSANISTPVLKTPDNYSAPVFGNAAGTTRITSLSRIDLVGANTNWTWRYAVGDNKFAPPAKASNVSSLTTNILNDGSITDISANPKQYILLLAVDDTGLIQGYANIYVNELNIRPSDSTEISGYSLEKGSIEGSTRFKDLSFTGISGASQWWYKVQTAPFTVPIGKDTKVTGTTRYNYSETLKPDITINANEHILLLATDADGKVKAYKDITVAVSQIQNPFAMLLLPSTNYTAPQPGSDDGTTKITLKATNIPNPDSEAVVWKYKISTQEFAKPHLDDADTGYSTTASGSDITVQPYNHLLIVATIGNKVKAYVQFQITTGQVKPVEAGDLVQGTNYQLPVPGSQPGTTKIEYKYLNTIDLPSDTVGWVIKVVDSEQFVALNSTLINPTVYGEDMNIPVKVGQFVILAAVDKDGRVKAYENLEIVKAQLNAPLAEKFIPANNNYSKPGYGSVLGSTSIAVSLNGLNNATRFVVKVVNADEAEAGIKAGTIITVVTGSAITYYDYDTYSTRADIAVKAGQYVVLIAVDNTNTVVAYENIPIPESAIRPGDAYVLAKDDGNQTGNYSALQPGTAVGTVKFTYLANAGIPGFDGQKWIVRVVDDPITTAPILNSSVDDTTAIVYTVQSNIENVIAGKYIALYAVDSTSAIKGYACIEVKAEDVKGVAPLLVINSTSPEPGTALNTTMIAANEVTLPAGTTLKYIVQNSSAGNVLKDSKLTGLQTYTFGNNIIAAEKQFLLFAATDSNGYIKACKEIIVTSDMLSNVKVTLGVGGTISPIIGEDDILSGGKTITVTLDTAEWVEDVLSTKAKRDLLFKGFVAKTESTLWDKVVGVLINDESVPAELTDSKTITIALSQTIGYNITKNQAIALTVNSQLIKNAVKPVVATNEITIAADVLVKLIGTTVLSKADIVAGGKQIVIELTDGTLPNGEFAQDITTNKAKRDAIFIGLKATYKTAEWKNVIDALKLAADAYALDVTKPKVITRNSSSKLTIALQPVAVSDYIIDTNEIINVIVPYKAADGGQILVGAIKDATALIPIVVTADTAASLSGTLLLAPISEADILLGGKTLIITLADGQWATDIATNKDKRDALFGGLTSSDTTPRNALVAALIKAGQSAIERTNDSTVTITLPAVLATNYNITKNQDITLTIPYTPYACIIGAKSALTAGQTITIERLATATLAGTVGGSTEAGIRTGGKTIIITLKDATWVDNVDTNSIIKNALLDGLKADVETEQWVSVIAKLKNGEGSFKKNSTAGATIVTITLPASDYDITAVAQTIKLTIPTSAAIGTSFDTIATGSLVIARTTTSTVVTEVNTMITDKTYKTGDTVDITVTFDSKVAVTGTPYFILETGTTDRNATYSSGSGDQILTFKYIVQAGDTSQKLDYKAGSIQTGTIVNASTSIAVTRTLPTVISGKSLSASNIIIDGVAPAFVSTYPKVDPRIAENEADILVKVNDTADIHYVVVPYSDSNVAPSIEDITAGKVNEVVVPNGTVVATQNTEFKIPLTGLTGFTGYTVYMFAQDSNGNNSAVTSVSFDRKAPIFNKNELQPISDNSISVVVNVNEVGNVYLLALPVGSQEQTSALVKASTASTKAMAIVNAVDINTDMTLKVTGLPVSTKYDIYLVCEDASKNIIATPVKLTAETASLNLTNVGVDLAKSILTNTTGQMQYSFDTQTWITCSTTAVNTTISYDDNAQMFQIYIRETKNIANTVMLQILDRGDENTITLSSINYNILEKTITNTSTLNLQYKVYGSDVWKALNAATLNGATITTDVDFAQGPLSVRTAATSPVGSIKSILPSAAKTLVNILVPMSAPDLEYDDTTNEIKGLLSTHEYRIDGVTWVNGRVKGDFAGTKKVEIRDIATTVKLPSTAQEIYFTACTIKVVASPVTADKTLNKNFVTITFEENTNKKVLAVKDIQDYFIVGTTVGATYVPHAWGADFTTKWNTAGNILTIIYNTMTSATTVKMGDEVSVSASAGIKKAGASATDTSYTSTGKLTGTFHTVPTLTVKAENGDGKVDFGAGDRIVITFDQPTNKPDIKTGDINTYLILSDSLVSQKDWGITDDGDIVWNSDGTKLTITFDATAVTKTELKLTDKITVDPTWGLTDGDETTEACNFNTLIGGSFTSTPIIKSAVISNGGASTNKEINDIIKITFDQATNGKVKVITSDMLINYFKLLSADGKTVHYWGVQNDITWSPDYTVLTVTVTSTTGLTLTKNDILTLNPSAGIKAEDGGTASCGASITIGGSY